jgi:hypothetical protein
VSGYLDRLVERGKTTLGALRAPAAGVEDLDLYLVESEGPATKAVTPRTAEEAAIREPLVHVEPAMEQSVEGRVAPAPAPKVPPAPQWLGRAALPEPKRPAPDVCPPALRDAGIRSTEPLRLSPARAALSPTTASSRVPLPAKPVEPISRPVSRERPDPGEPQSAPSREIHLGEDGPRHRAEIPPALLERWPLLRERLLIAHPPTAAPPERPWLPEEPLKTRLQPTPSAARAPRAVVIRSLEVTVAAPPPQTPPPPPPTTPQPTVASDSGAWTLAGRRYLGRI